MLHGMQMWCWKYVMEEREKLQAIPTTSCYRTITKQVWVYANICCPQKNNGLVQQHQFTSGPRSLESFGLLSAGVSKVNQQLCFKT